MEHRIFIKIVEVPWRAIHHINLRGAYLCFCPVHRGTFSLQSLSPISGIDIIWANGFTGVPSCVPNTNFCCHGPTTKLKLQLGFLACSFSLKILTKKKKKQGKGACIANLISLDFYPVQIWPITLHSLVKYLVPSSICVIYFFLVNGWLSLLVYHNPDCVSPLTPQRDL